MSEIVSAIPSKGMLKVANTIMPVILQSPLHGMTSGFMLLLSFKGRKSGRQFLIPVSYHRVDGVITVFTGAAWINNLRSDPNLEVILQGKRRAATADIVDDPATVAQAVQRVLTEIGPKNAARFAFKVTGDVPPVDQVQAALEGRKILRLTLT